MGINFTKLEKTGKSKNSIENLPETQSCKGTARGICGIHFC